MEEEIKQLFPTLTDEQILKGIKRSVLHIRSQIPTDGETKIKWVNKGNCHKYVCPCGAEYDNYVTFCRDGCMKNNCSLA